MSRRLLALAALALLALPAALPGGAASGHHHALDGSPGGAPEPEPRPVEARFSLTPDAFFPSASALPRGVAVKTWLHLSTEDALDDTVTLNASGATVNRTTIPVRLDAGETGVYPVTVTALGVPQPGNMPMITLLFNDTRTEAGEPLVLSHYLADVTPVSVTLVEPAVEYRTVSTGHRVPDALKRGAHEAVAFRARVTNHGAEATAPMNLTLEAPQWGPLATVAVEPLDPGESRTLDLTTFRLADRRGGNGDVGTVFHVSIDAGGAPEKGRHYTLDDGRLLDYRDAERYITFYSGVNAELVANRYALNEPSWALIEVTNFGDAPERGFRIDVFIRPDPPVNYGVGGPVSERHVLNLDPGETKRINVTFTPKVAGALRTGYRTYSTHGYSETSDTTNIPSPVRATFEGDAVTTLPLGGSATLPFAVTSARDLPDAEVGVAVAAATMRGPGDAGATLARFITMRDLVDLTLDGPSGGLAANATVTAEARVVADAAGVFTLVPYVRSGGLVYPARVDVTGYDSDPRSGDFDDVPYLVRTGGGNGDPLALHVRGETPSVASVWLPTLLVMAGFGGYWATRGRWVR